MGPAGSVSSPGPEPPCWPMTLVPSANCNPRRKDRRGGAGSGPPGTRSPGPDAPGTGPEPGGHEDLEPGRVGRYPGDRHSRPLSPAEHERAGRHDSRKFGHRRIPGMMYPGLRLCGRHVVKEAHVGHRDPPPARARWGRTHLRSGPGPTARERGRRREAGTRRAVSKMSPSPARCIRTCDCTCICPVQSWTPCLPRSLRPVPFTPARAFLSLYGGPQAVARSRGRGQPAVAGSTRRGQCAVAGGACRASPGSRTGAGPADRASARGRRRRRCRLRAVRGASRRSRPAARASCARSCGGCRTSTSGPSASRSSTAASMESIRTQASAQSPRPAAGGAP